MISRFTECEYKNLQTTRRLTNLWTTSSTEDAMSIWSRDMSLSRLLSRNKIGTSPNAEKKTSLSLDLKTLTMPHLLPKIQKGLGHHKLVKQLANILKNLITGREEEQHNEMQRLFIALQIWWLAINNRTSVSQTLVLEIALACLKLGKRLLLFSILDSNYSKKIITTIELVFLR